MTIRLDGSSLTIEDVVRVARHGEKVELAPEALERINTCRAMLEKKIEAHEIMYGVNTGIGEFSEVVLNDEQVQAVPALPHLQPRGGHRRAAPDRARARGDAEPHQRARAGLLRLPARDHADLRRDAQRGRHAGGLREGQRRRLRRPRADEPDAPCR